MGLTRFHCPWQTRFSRLHVVLLAVFSLAITSLFASPVFLPEPEEVFTGSEAGAWARVERLSDPHPGFTQEAFCAAGEQNDPWIIKWFGGDTTPHSRSFLLHCAKGFEGKTLPEPILLVHGAGDNANRAWIHPYAHSLPQKISEKERGFALWLSDLGYAVFAVSFAHNQGCNIMQAEHVANAISRIRTLMKREGDPNFKVNVVAHSKGNVVTRIYCSDAPKIFPKKKFLSAFRKDVDTYIGIGPAFRGIDTPFRYYGYNLQIATQKNSNGPVAAESLLLYGFWRNMKEMSLYKDAANYFPGQCQLLFNLVRDANVPLGVESMTLDMVTPYALYFGGISPLMTSRGIEKAIDEGERLIYRLEEQGFNPNMKIGVIAGSSPFITYKDAFTLTPMPWEYLTPAGDGLVYLASALHTDNAIKRGAKLIGKKTVDLNHVDIGRNRDVVRIIDDWLQAH